MDVGILRWIAVGGLVAIAGCVSTPGVEVYRVGESQSAVGRTVSASGNTSSLSFYAEQSLQDRLAMEAGGVFDDIPRQQRDVAFIRIRDGYRCADYADSRRITRRFWLKSGYEALGYRGCEYVGEYVRPPLQDEPVEAVRIAAEVMGLSCLDGDASELECRYESDLWTRGGIMWAPGTPVSTFQNSQKWGGVRQTLTMRFLAGEEPVFELAAKALEGAPPEEVGAR